MHDDSLVTTSVPSQNSETVRYGDGFRFRAKESRVLVRRGIVQCAGTLHPSCLISLAQGGDVIQNQETWDALGFASAILKVEGS